MKIMGNIIGLDFGTKRVGVAIGQMLTGAANPLGVINVCPTGLSTWDALDKIISEWTPTALVVGLPLNMDGTAQPITKQAKKFAEFLRQRYQLPLYLADERLSSRAARDHLFQRGGYRALQAKPIDGHAAAIILSSWLEAQLLNERPGT